MDKLKSEYEQLKEVRDNFFIAIFRYVFNVPLILFFILLYLILIALYIFILPFNYFKFTYKIAKYYIFALSKIYRKIAP